MIPACLKVVIRDVQGTSQNVFPCLVGERNGCRGADQISAGSGRDWNGMDYHLERNGTERFELELNGFPYMQ